MQHSAGVYIYWEGEKNIFPRYKEMKLHITSVKTSWGTHNKFCLKKWKHLRDRLAMFSAVLVSHWMLQLLRKQTFCKITIAHTVLWLNFQETTAFSESPERKKTCKITVFEEKYFLKWGQFVLEAGFNTALCQAGGAAGLEEAAGKGARAAGGAAAAPRSPAAPQHPAADPQQGERRRWQEAGPQRRGALGAAAHLGTSSCRLPSGAAAGEGALCPAQASADPRLHGWRARTPRCWRGDPETGALRSPPPRFGSHHRSPAGWRGAARDGRGRRGRGGRWRLRPAPRAAPRRSPPLPSPACRRRSAPNLSQPSSTEPRCAPPRLLPPWPSRAEPRS